MDSKKETAPDARNREQEFKKMLEQHCAKSGETVEDCIAFYEKRDPEYAAELKRRAGLLEASSE